MSRQVVVKWNKNVYDQELNDDETIEKLRQRLMDLTNVPVDRQKLMYKSKMLKDDGVLASVGVGNTIVLMGTSEVVSMTAPTRQVVFTEDISSEQKSQFLQLGDKIGLRNLGNTCYMSGVLQVLKNIPEVLTQCSNVATKNSMIGELSSKYVQLVRTMNNSTSSVAPIQVLSGLRKSCPQFNETSDSGMYAQQDSDECLNAFLQQFSKEARAVESMNNSSSSSHNSQHSSKRGFDNWVDETFSARALTTTEVVDKSLDEPQGLQEDHLTKLRCEIDSSVNHLIEGIRLSMKETVTKRSSVGHMSTEYTRKTELIDLPQHLFVQLSRFMWRGDTKKKAKILRRVTLPHRLDLFEFLTSDMKETVGKVREEKLQEKAKTVAKQMDGIMTDNTQVQGNLTLDAQKRSLSCEYQQTGIIAHKGRDAEGGHYVAYVRKEQQWYRCDDADVTVVPESEVDNLAGGGDWQMAYICHYSKV